MASYSKGAGLLIAVLTISLLIGWMIFPGGMPKGSDWTVDEDGILSYGVPGQTLTPRYNLSREEDDGNSSLFAVGFISRGAGIEGLLRIPKNAKMDSDNDGRKRAVPGIVLLPGASVTKEREQGLALLLAELGYATLTLDQRNLGAVDADADREIFIEGREPVEYMMVHDALAAAQILRSQPGIDPERIIYAGESNGGRFAIIACSLDKRAGGVLAISTSGYGTDAAVARAGIADKDAIRFYRSIDPETYLSRVSPRPLVMIHSKNDTIIPYTLAEKTYALASPPKSLTAVGCTVHGYCQEMNEAIDAGLKSMAV